MGKKIKDCTPDEVREEEPIRHPFDDIVDGKVMVRCPDCGQLEWWTPEEVQDHGICRCNPIMEDGKCPECGEEIQRYELDVTEQDILSLEVDGQ